MKLLMTYIAKPRTSPPPPEHAAEIARFTEEMAKAGILVMTGGMARPSTGTKIRMEGGKFAVTDGPFAETKELIDGFALVQTKSKQEALNVAERFMKIAGDGEVLQVFDPSEDPE